MSKNLFLKLVVGAVIIVVGVGAWKTVGKAVAAPQESTVEVPDLQFDVNWPKQLPNSWVLGAIGAMWIDSKDHVWLANRPAFANSAGDRWAYLGLAECCRPAPPIIELDPAGNVAQGWGPLHDDQGKLLKGEKWTGEWLASEHGIGVDEQNKVIWVSSYYKPSKVVKYTSDGKKFLMRIGGAKDFATNDDTENLAGPTSIVPDPANNEVYIADGYFNRRIIVFDATTGKFKRMWGAYGHKPEGMMGGVPVEIQKEPERDLPKDYPTIYEPAPPDWKDDPAKRSKQFATIHCLHMSKDRLLYVCDRTNNRIQVFKTDGTYMKEGVVAPKTRAWGTLHDLAFSGDPEQKYIYVADGTNRHIWILRRSDLKVLTYFSHGGRGAGEIAVAHAIGSDSKGNVYVGDTVGGNRVMRWLYKGTKRVTPVVVQ
jgi:hypothetical protein